jgi:cytochrome c-type biogenesis protein CcmH/NrfG
VRDRFRSDQSTVRHAHGYIPQILSDLGWAGLALSLLTLGAWLWAAARAIGVRLRARGQPWTAERVSVATLAAVVVVFGVHSSVDWTWFIPGNAVPALLCAGWVAAQGPLSAPVTGPPPREGGLLAPVGAGLVMLVAFAGAWSALQPVRSEHAESAAFDRLDRGQIAAAASIAEIAHKRDPLAINPLFDIASIQTALGHTDAAGRALDQAVQLEPATAETWRRLAQFRMDARHDAKGALRAYRAAYFLDPSKRSASDVIITARIVKAGQPSP